MAPKQPDANATQPRLAPAHPETLAQDESPTTGEYTAAEEPAADPVTVGIYKVEKLLGQGGMGAVYLAEDASLERKVALKVMKRSVAANPIARERFIREAKAAAKVENDHIIRVYQVGEERGVPFIAMEYLKGKPLDVWMKDAKPTAKQILRIGTEAALGLSAAHKAGLIHRDIKPANLWLEAPTGRVKVLDFGLARPVQEETHLTTTGVVVGTPAYMSPEQGRGKELDHRTDLFSLGCVLYHLATGQRPFTGANTYEIIASLIADTPAPPHELNPAMPPALSAAILQMLEKDAAKRPATAKQVADELTRILKSQTSVIGAGLPPAAPMPRTASEPSTAWQNLDESGSEVMQVNTTDAVKLPKIVKVKPPRHSKMMWIIGSAIAALFVVIAGGSFLYQYLNKPKEVVVVPPPPPTLGTRKVAETVPPPTTVATKPEVKPPVVIPPRVARNVVLPDELKKLKGGEEVEFEIAPGVKIIFCWIPPGEATLGSPVTEKKRESNEPEHKYVCEGFWMGKYPVTQREYQAVLGNNPSYFTLNHEKMKASGIAETSRFPVEQVSWDDCQEFCKRVNVRTGISKVFSVPGKFALPHEDDWEYACRGGKGNFQPFYWGSAVNGTQSNCKGTEPYGTNEKGPYLQRTTEVGAYAKVAPHPWGLCDMAGNVRNWCDNMYSTEPEKRVVRGAYWSNDALYCRSAYRFGLEPAFRRNGGGFRLVLQLPDTPTPSGNPPLDPEWVKRVSALPPQEQFEEVKKEIIRRNPGFEKDGVFEWASDKKTGISCCHKELKDIEPIMMLSGIKDLSLCDWDRLNYGVRAGFRSSLSNIEPISKLGLESVNLSATQINDLSPLRNMPIKSLRVDHLAGLDFTPLKGKELVLSIKSTGVQDLSSLEHVFVSHLILGNEINNLHKINTSSLGVLEVQLVNGSVDLTF